MQIVLFLLPLTFFGLGPAIVSSRNSLQRNRSRENQKIIKQIRYVLKVSKFQKENMKSSHFPKSERKNLKNSVLNTQDRIFQIFSFRFWEVRRLHIFLLKFADLQDWHFEKEKNSAKNVTGLSSNKLGQVPKEQQCSHFMHIFAWYQVDEKD